MWKSLALQSPELSFLPMSPVAVVAELCQSGTPASAFALSCSWACTSACLSVWCPGDAGTLYLGVVDWTVGDAACFGAGRTERARGSCRG